jgi:hypothetical protein
MSNEPETPHVPITSSNAERVRRLDDEAREDARVFGGKANPCPLCGAESHAAPLPTHIEKEHP